MDAPPPRIPSDPDEPVQQQRLWTPWRMRYIGGHVAEDGCLFCNRLAGDDDVGSLILHRGHRAFVIMNLFPYNTGHLMIVPNEHVAGPDATDPDTLAAMAMLLRPVVRALRRVLRCDGFNVGMNVGAVAGAGVADHLHQHVVPRWVGDANFMPILASTMVLPELIPVSYAKIRAELTREVSSLPLGDSARVSIVLLAADDSRLLAIDSPTGALLPTASADGDQALWRAAQQRLAGIPGGVELAGWSGPARAGSDDTAALTFRAVEPDALPLPADWSWLPTASSRSLLADERDREIVAQALANLAPSVMQP